MYDGISHQEWDEGVAEAENEREYHAERIANCKFPFRISHSGKKSVNYRDATPSLLELARFVSSQFPELPSELWLRQDGTPEWEEGSFTRAALWEMAKALWERRWQPISTAPKDGTWILATATNAVPAVVRWEDNGWVENESNEGDRSWPLTYWMPVPNSPRN